MQTELGKKPLTSWTSMIGSGSPYEKEVRERALAEQREHEMGAFQVLKRKERAKRKREKEEGMTEEEKVEWGFGSSAVADWLPGRKKEWRADRKKRRVDREEGERAILEEEREFKANFPEWLAARKVEWRETRASPT